MVENSYALNAGQREYVARVQRVANEHLAEVPAVHGAVNRPLLRALGDHGLLRGLFGGTPEETPRDAAAMQLCLLRETLATVTTEAETALALQGLGSYPILQSGQPAAVERWIPGVVTGETVAALCPVRAGCRLRRGRAGPAGRPRQATGSWLLTGEKLWISNAPEADVYSVFARTTQGARAGGVTAFVVAGDADGLSGEALDMVAPHAVGRLVFDGVRVTEDDVLGEVDGGFAVAMRTLDLFRPSVGAFAVGMAQSALDAAVAWTTTRSARRAAGQTAVGRAHARRDGHQDRASRLLVHAAASAYDAGAPAAEITTSAAMAKLFATETAQWVVDQAVQLHGARGLQKGHLLERLYREVRAPRIYEGASEVQRTIIGRGLVRDHQKGTQ